MKYSTLKFTFFTFITGLFFAAAASAQNIDITGPAGSGEFGKEVKALPNGNIVVIDPGYNAGAVTDVGAVYLYNGASGALISTMTGTQNGDNVGSGGIVVLYDGDFLVRSLVWHNGPVVNASAVTRCSKTAGCPSTVSTANSLVGSHANDGVGNQVVVLTNGNYVIGSRLWDNGTVDAAGAVTWCHKTAGCPAGVITSTNSLVGERAGDIVGSRVTALTNGNYIIASPGWDNGTLTEAGAVTWADGTTGITGFVSDANSLVGLKSGDFIGGGGVGTLPNGNYLVNSPVWDNGTVNAAGAVTYCNGTTGLTGPVTPSNSLVGTKENDVVGDTGVAVLTNGNYVVGSPFWNNGGIQNAGAATWGNGTTGITGPVTEANSIVGSATGDQVGYTGGIWALPNGNYVILSDLWGNSTGAVTWGNGSTGTAGVVSSSNSLIGTAQGDPGWNGLTFLTNGNYVVRSPFWDNAGLIDAGAATLCSGSGGCSGLISPSNSLVGTAAFDLVSQYGVIPLPNGNYVVSSPHWNNAGVVDAGAVTWGNGTTGVTGQITPANSLVGSTAGDTIGLSAGVQVDQPTIIALTNGNYVVASSKWDGISMVDAGAVTWGNGGSGITGTITAQNSLTGSAASQFVGGGGVTALTNGNYVVSSPGWDTTGANNAGAVTWADGSTGITGTISAGNSLVGSAANDQVGYADDPVFPLANGNYILRSRFWDNGALNSAGALSRGNGTLGTKGAINPGNSVLGNTPGGGLAINFSYDEVNSQIIVGRPADNIVTFFRMAATVSIGGRITNANGQPISNAIVQLTAPGGQRISVQTGNFGFYQFDQVPTGVIYTISPSAKRYRFGLPRSIFVDATVTDLDFKARPQE